MPVEDTFVVVDHLVVCRLKETSFCLLLGWSGLSWTCCGPEKVLERMAEPVLVMGDGALQVELQPFIALLLPEVPHALSCSARDAVLALNFQPEGGATGAFSVGQSKFEHFDALTDRIAHFLRGEVELEAARILVVEVQIGVVAQQLPLLDRVDEPPRREDISRKI